MNSDRESEATFFRQQLALHKELVEIIQQMQRLQTQKFQVLDEKRNHLLAYNKESGKTTLDFKGRNISVDGQCYHIALQENLLLFEPFEMLVIEDQAVDSMTMQDEEDDEDDKDPASILMKMSSQ